MFGLENQVGYQIPSRLWILEIFTSTSYFSMNTLWGSFPSLIVAIVPIKIVGSFICNSIWNTWEYIKHWFIWKSNGQCKVFSFTSLNIWWSPTIKWRINLWLPYNGFKSRVSFRPRVSLKIVSLSFMISLNIPIKIVSLGNLSKSFKDWSLRITILTILCLIAHLFHFGTSPGNTLNVHSVYNGNGFKLLLFLSIELILAIVSFLLICPWFLVWTSIGIVSLEIATCALDSRCYRLIILNQTCFLRMIQGPIDQLEYCLIHLDLVKPLFPFCHTKESVMHLF